MDVTWALFELFDSHLCNIMYLAKFPFTASYVLLCKISMFLIMQLAENGVQVMDTGSERVKGHFGERYTISDWEWRSQKLWYPCLCDSYPHRQHNVKIKEGRCQGLILTVPILSIKSADAYFSHALYIEVKFTNILLFLGSCNPKWAFRSNLLLWSAQGAPPPWRYLSLPVSPVLCHVHRSWAYPSPSPSSHRPWWWPPPRISSRWRHPTLELRHQALQIRGLCVS